MNEGTAADISVSVVRWQHNFCYNIIQESSVVVHVSLCSLGYDQSHE